MCLLILCQQSYLLIVANWIQLAIATQIAISEEAEYYGIYDPNIINTAFTLAGFKAIEFCSTLLFKRIAIAQIKQQAAIEVHSN